MSDTPSRLSRALRRLAPRRPTSEVPVADGGPAIAGAGAEALGGSDRPRLAAVDGYRGYAAVAVLLYHVMYGTARPALDDGFVRSVLVSGYMGIDFFFVISGFVLFLPAVTNGGRLGNIRSYALRRAARILPAYYVVIVAVVLLHPLIVDQPAWLPQTSLKGVLNLLLHLTFLEHSVGLLLGLQEGFAIHGAVWTLTLEAGFYIVLPVVAGWYYRRPLIGLGIAIAVAALAKVGATHWPSSIPWLLGGERSNLRFILVTQFPTYLGHFAAGMTAAWLFVKLRALDRRRLVARLAVPAQVVALVVIVLSMRSAGIRDLGRVDGVFVDSTGRAFFDHWTNTTHVGLAFAVLLLATVLAPRWAQWPATNRVARFLGDASFGIYLWHLVIIGFALQTLHFAPDHTDFAFVRMLAITLPGSILLGWLSFVFLERPFVRWAKVRSRRIEHPPAPSRAAAAGPVSPALVHE